MRTSLISLVLLFLICPANADSLDRDFYPDRPEVQQFIAELVHDENFDSENLTRLFTTLRPVVRAIELIKPPADPGIRSWQRYRARFIEPKRIAAGKRFMTKYRIDLARAEARYGVPREIIAGVIGVETIYGKHTGDFGTFATLATLAFDYPPRAALFRKELRELLLLARDEKRPVTDYRGSYAGALGLPQFLPSSIRRYAIDFDGDGHIDLQRSAPDAIGSVARYLSDHGWQREEPVATTVRVSGEAVASAIADGIEPRKTVGEWNEAGLELSKVGAGDTAFDFTATELSRPAALIDLVTPDSTTEYRLGYQNFYVITRYNKSTFYAAAVMDLAAALSRATDQ